MRSSLYKIYMRMIHWKIFLICWIIHLYVYVIKRMQAYLLQGMRVYF